MIILNCYDDKPCGPEEVTADMLSPTHCGIVGRDGTIEYPYQAELWVRAIEADRPWVVRVECPALSRTWVRRDGKMVEDV